MLKRYLLCLLIATIALLTGCDLPFGGSPTPTPIPFALYDSQDVLNAFTSAGLDARNPQPLETAGRDEPGGFRERISFEIASIAPAGGQIITFDTAEQLAEWNAYIERLRANSATRRTVIYVYTKNNVMVQLNNALTNQQAMEYREALEAMSIPLGR